MTSLIFGSIYLGHQGFVKHRRDKQNRKNYERWEGLRDEYDDQKRTQRESRSLDIQRTGQYDNGYGYGSDDRPILTLRDQQEANDARTGWRPQESWETHDERKLREQATGYQPVTAHGRPERRSMDAASLYAPRPGEHRSISLATGYDNMQREQSAPGSYGASPSQYQSSPAAKRLSSQKTGAVWDEGLPPPLPVGRRNWDDQNESSSNLPSRTPSQRASLQPSPQPQSTPFDNMDQHSKTSSRESLPRVPEHAPNASGSHIPGGFMAQLIEGQSQAAPVQPTQRSNNPFEQSNGFALPPQTSNVTSAPRSNNPFDNMAHGVQTPAGEKDMTEWWK